MAEQLTRSLICKVNVLDKHEEKLLETMSLFRDICNYISEFAWENRIFNFFRLSKETYKKAREKFPQVHSDLVVNAIRFVANSYKANKKTKHTFKKLFVCYRKNSITFKKDYGSFFIATIWILEYGRVPVAVFVPRKYAKYIHEMKWVSWATLHYHRGSKEFYIHITIKEKIELKEGKTPVGVDLNLSGYILVAVRNGKVIFKAKGGPIKAVRERYFSLRSKIQKLTAQKRKRKGGNGNTWSLYRLLIKLSRKEKQAVNTLLHTIAKQFVDTLEEGDVVVFENLKHLRERTRVRKKQRRNHNLWAYAKLQFLVEYKAKLRGIPVVYVDPKYTSQRCPRCGYIHKSNRKSQKLFRCNKCGYQDNADIVSAKNLACLWEQAPKGKE